MKRLLSLALTVILMFCLTGCSGGDPAADNVVKADNEEFYHGYISSQPTFLIKTSFGAYLQNFNLAYDSVNMNDINDRKKVLMYESGEDGYFFHSLYTAQDGNEFYGWENSDRSSDLYHFFLTDAETIHKETWVDRDVLVESCVSESHDPERMITLKNFISDGDSVYATVGYDVEYMISQTAINGRIVRISKSGDTIEFIGDDSVRAEELVVKDGWIYYTDNGYTPTGEKSFSYDNEKTGIYKVKTDGSGKELLYKGDGKIDGYSQQIANAGDLALFGDQLYFLDLNNDSRICRIKTDGTGYEPLSAAGASLYTIDPDTGDIYYITGSWRDKAGEDKRYIRLDIDTKTEKEFFRHTIYLQAVSYYDGSLYGGVPIFSDRGIIRITPETGKAQELVSRTEGNGWDIDENGEFKRDENGKPVYKEGTTTIEWVDL